MRYLAKEIDTQEKVGTATEMPGSLSWASVWRVQYLNVIRTRYADIEFVTPKGF